MSPEARRRPSGKATAKRRKGGRATAKRRARALVRASRPKQKPRRTPKPRSRARRIARSAEAREIRGVAPSASPAAAKRAAGAKRRAPRAAVLAGNPRAAKAAVAPAKPRKRTPGAKPRAAQATVSGAGRPRRPRRPAAPPAFPQTVGASERHRLIFRMVKARASVLAAVQGMGAAVAERPLGEGRWGCRETILHLVTRDRARLREMEAALRGTHASWAGIDPGEQSRVNEEDLAPLRAVSWEDAVRLLLTTRQALMEAVESIPEEPAEVWGEAHALGWMFQRLPGHDLHHADIIKRWRTGQGV